VKDERPQATAWFPPLPPAETDRDVAVRVSPAVGQRGVVVTKSMFREPIMLIWGFFVSIFMEGFGYWMFRCMGIWKCWKWGFFEMLACSCFLGIFSA